jgi:2-desacetyl-2-hydroxyethyl bacteriochlorophyllide A dehydrogenase
MPRELLLTAPRELRLVEYEEAPLRPGQVRAEAIISGISHGTELAAYRGTSPHAAGRFDRELRLFVEGAGPLYPQTLGYEWVGVVREVGVEVAGFGAGDVVHLPLPHRGTHTFAAAGEAERPSPGLVPAGLEPEAATMLESARIALAAVHDARVKVGDHVAVFGLGVFGLLAVQLARLSGAGRIDAVDPIERRRTLAETLGADRTLDPGAQDVGRELTCSSERGGADVAIEFSGRYDALHEALRSVCLGGTVVAAGFYQGGAGELRLGEEFHHNRLTLVGSMSGWGAPHRDAPAWDRLRLRATAADFLARGALRTDGFVTHRVPFDRAAEAYELVDRAPEDVLRVVLTYS